MTYVMVDVEADGPCPGLYSMIAMGMVVVEPGLERRFKALLRPLPGASFVPEALAVSGFTRQQTMEFPLPGTAIVDMVRWLQGIDRPMFVSDNNGFDWQFVCYYCHNFLGRNPFGHSSTNLGSLYKGVVRDLGKNFKHLRKTKHDHDPLNDAIGNAEAMLEILDMMRMKGAESPFLGKTSGWTIPAYWKP